MATERNLTDPEDLAANRRGVITDAQRRAATATDWRLGRLLGLTAVLAGALLLPLGMGMLVNNLEAAGVGLVCLTLLFAAPLALFLALQATRLYVTRQDLSDGQLSVADGEVRWRGRRYAVEIPGRAFWTSDAVTNLVPGAYRFYYLPRSGHVLSAQALSGLTLAGEDSDLDQALRRAHNFSLADVDANRAGRLSAAQRMRLLLSAGQHGALVLGLTGLAVFAVWSLGGDYSCGIAALAVAGLLYLLFAGALSYVAWLLVLDALRGRVEQVAGVATRLRVTAGGQTRHYYEIQDRRFAVSSRAYGTLIPDQYYRCYYVPRSQRLMSLVRAKAPSVEAREPSP